MIISLGENCVVAIHLKSRGLRNESFPFDWSCSNPKVIKDFIEMNGDEVLRVKSKVYLEYVNPELYWPHHDHDLTNDACFDYVSRCWKRFRECLNSGCKIKFISFTPMGMKVDVEALRGLSDVIKRLYHDNFEIYALCFKVGDEEGIEDWVEGEINIFRFNVLKEWSVESGDWCGVRDMKLWNEFFERIMKID